MKARTLALIGALALPGLANAQQSSPSAAPPSGTQAPAASPRAPSATQEPKVDKQKMKEEEKRITDAFKGQQNFEMKGTLLGADAEHGSIVLQRGDLPVAFLIVPETADVMVNGKKSSLATLQPGAEVRASFNLVQQYPVALQINATQNKNTKPPPGAVPTTPPSQHKPTQP